ATVTVAPSTFPSFPPRRSSDLEVVDICEMRAEVFPPVLEPGTVVGAVSAGAASETGLRAGTPVVVGGADTQLGLVGIGVVGSGRSEEHTSELQARSDIVCRLLL